MEIISGTGVKTVSKVVLVGGIVTEVVALSRGSSGGGGDSSGSQRWKLNTVVVPSSANGYTGDNGDGKEAIVEIIVVVVVGVMDVVTFVE